MTQDEMNVAKVFDPFDVEPDERIKRSSGGYTKIEDGQTVKMRFTMNMYRFYKFTPEGAMMPMQNADAKDLLENRKLDDIFEDQTIRVSEGWCAIIWNYETEQAEVWQFSRKVFDNLKALNRDSDWDGGLAKNDIKVTRSGKKTDTTYSISYSKTSGIITSEMDQKILEVPVERMVAGAVRL